MSDNEKSASTSVYSGEDVGLQFLQKVKHDHDRSQITSGISDFKGSKPLPKKLLFKIDCYIIPIMMIVYLFMYLDSVILNYAAAVGIKKILKGNEYANLVTIYGAAFIFGEPFVSYCLQRFPVAKTLGVFICFWGIIICCHAACHSYAALMICRTLLGFFESACSVGLLAISSMYYTKAEPSARIGWWCTMAGMGHIVGGLLSYGFQFVHHGVLKPWQILFLTIGAASFVIGCVILVIVPDNPTSAWFLTEEEKILVVEHVRSNQTGVENKKFKMEQIKELFFQDKYTWPMLALTAISQMSTGALGYFSVTVLKTFGFTNKESALLQLPIGVIDILAIGISTQLTAWTGNWTLVVLSMQLPSIIGCICLTALPLDNKYGNLFGLYLIYPGSCVIANIYLWNTFNTAGHTKRVFRNAAMMVSYSVATLVMPQTFQDYSAPRYMPAKITLLVTQCVCVPLMVYIGSLARNDNKERDAQGIKELPENFEFMDMTDIQNPNFRYIW